MGVSGSGKSTIGLMLSHRLGWQFYEGDNYHPPSNIKKMSCAIPLTDEDRQPWLQSLQKIIQEINNNNSNGVITCSALKTSYRELVSHHQEVFWVYLQGSYQQILTRIEQRPGHFMKSAMLRSQFEILEEPKDALVISVDANPEAIVEQIITQILA